MIVAPNIQHPIEQQRLKENNMACTEGTNGISHYVKCKKCGSGNFLCSHIKDEIEICQCCGNRLSEKRIKKMDIKECSKTCKCGGQIYIPMTVYGVSYLVCKRCGEITFSKKDSFDGCKYCGSRNIDISGTEWECRDCGCHGLILKK